MVRDGVTRQVLDNGLTVLIREMHHAPVASSWLWFRVGSRDEVPGITGISHWVEHMMFKGTPKVPKGELDRLIARHGGYSNAMTWIDWTAYHETLPAAQIDLALEIEADRMRNALFDPGEVEAERAVVISERQGAENDPGFRLGEAVHSTAFRVHPYRHAVIGELEDLERITRDDLYAHYCRYYTPNNAVLVLSGDVQSAVMLSRITSLFGELPAGSSVTPVDVAERPQTEMRRVVVEGDGTTTFLILAFHAPRADDPDFLPVLVLNAILVGIGKLSPFGSGSANRSSRLYKALVDADLASSVAGSLPITLDPYLYTLFATARSGCAPQEIEAMMWDQVEQVVLNLAAPEELGRALKQAKAHLAYSSESVTNQALWFGFAEVLQDYTWFTNLFDRLNQVTREDVRRVASKYLKRSNCTVGWYVPYPVDGKT